MLDIHLHKMQRMINNNLVISEASHEYDDEKDLLNSSIEICNTFVN